MFELTVTGNIASGHSLRDYDGPCKNVHGHTWKVEVTVSSDRLDKLGMVIDFKVVKEMLNDFLEHIDHVYLNDLKHFQKVNPTTENIAKYIYEGFTDVCRPLKVEQVRVWESESSSIIYYEPS